MIRLFFYVLIVSAFLLSSCRSTRVTTIPKKEQAERKLLESKLGIALPEKYDQLLINALASWIGTPYRYGGESFSGTDCSGMVKAVYAKVYSIRLEHNAARQQELSKKIPEKQLREGDLVFFKIQSKKTDHVGIFLWQGYFIHASTKKGVLISNLSEPYYRKAFSGAGTYR